MDQKDKIEAIKQQVARDIKKTIVLAPECIADGEIVKTLKDSAAGQVRGAARSFCALIVDAKLLCECGNQAKYRPPPTRQPQLNKLMSIFFACREDQRLDQHDVIVGLDGGKGKDFDDKLKKAIVGSSNTTAADLKCFEGSIPFSFTTESV